MQTEPVQSVLHAAADSGAALIAQLGIVLYVGAAVLFVIVMALAIYGVLAKGRQVNARRWIVGGGLVLPIVTLSALLVYSLAVGNALSSVGATNPLQLFLDCFRADEPAKSLPPGRLLRIHVVGRQWWWEVSYELPGTDRRVRLANEVRIPIDRPVELVLSSSDVIHSFWAPSLAGKVDMIPGRTTRLRIQTSDTGRYRGQCAEYCGGQHALMAFYVVAQTPEDFASWLAKQARPQDVPRDPFLKRGYDAFFKGNCQSCHAIRGTPATATLGPDLTHVGSRTSLAAGVLDNHIGTMAGWIAGAQDVKPGNMMPSMPLYDGVELRALAAWLGSLQ